MKDLALLSSLYIFFFLSASAQVIEDTDLHTIDGLSSRDRISYVGFDTVSEQTTLYIERLLLNKMVVKTYFFDKNFDLETQFEEEYKVEGAGFEIRILIEPYEVLQRYKRAGEVTTREYISIEPLTTGKIYVQRLRENSIYNPITDDYFRYSDILDEAEIKLDDGGKVVLYESFRNLDKNEIYLLIGKKSSGGKQDKFQEARQFQIVRVNNDFTVDYLDELTFKHNMAVNFMKIIPDSGQFIPDGLHVKDISNSRALIVFSPIHISRDKTHTSAEPGKGQVVILDETGTVLCNEQTRFPDGGWAIEDVVIAPNGKDFFVYGPAQKGEYINQVKQMNLPFGVKMVPENVDWQGFQVMKVADNKVSWVKSVSVGEINRSMQITPDERKKIEYNGKRFLYHKVIVTPDGELFFCGQNRDKQTKVESGVVDSYLSYEELILLHFENNGDIKAAYGVRKAESNKYAKSMPTPQFFYLNPSFNTLVWLYGEIEGERDDELIVTPAVTKINLRSGMIGNIIRFGNRGNKKPDFYTNLYLPHAYITSENALILVGRDKKFDRIWFCKIDLGTIN